jgi:Ribonuclease G/E
VAVIDGAELLLDYAIWRPGRPDGVGDLHRGRVIARVPGMAGAFVALGGAEGFLPDSQGAAALTEGTVIGVRITRAAQGGKGPRLSAMLEERDKLLVGEGSPALVRRGPGAVERFAALYPDAPILVDDAGTAARLRPGLQARIVVVPTSFDDTLEEQIEALASPTAVLPGGGLMHVHATPALVSIDVDSGGASAGRGSKTTVQGAFNRRVLPDVARQIRLRNLSGPILVDLAGMKARRRTALASAFTDALHADPLRPRFLGFTALGFAEILRPRIHPPLHELLAGPHAAGLAALRRIAVDLRACPCSLPVLVAGPAIISALHDDPVALPELAERAGRRLILRSDPGVSGWRLEVPGG